MALGYLLGAAIQFEDKNGKPLVGGTIRVCLHGTSTPYLTYRDFNGNRNPEFVPLNAAGMCVLIADDAGVYDVYCKDQFGVEQWSRLNVTVGGAGGGGGGEEYYAGNGILINGANTISVDLDTVQGKLTAGSNITIDSSTSTISATVPSQQQANWNEADQSSVQYIQNKPDLSVYAETADLATVAETGAYADLSGKPTIPDSTSDLTNDSGFITLSDVPAQVQANWAETDTSSPSYILNKPADLPAIAGHAGDALIVNSQATGLEWGTPTAELYEAVYDTTTYAQVTQAIAAKKIVYCRVPQSGTAVRMAFLAYVGSNNAEFQYYRSKNSRTYSSPTDEVYVYTVNASGWTTAVRNTDYQIVAGSGLSYTVTTGTTPKLTLSADPQQQANWNEADQSSVQYIQNKPIIIPEPTQDTTQVNWWARNVDTNGVASWVSVPFNFYSMQTVWRTVTGTKADNVSYWGTDILIPDQVPVGVDIACNVIFDVSVEGLALGSYYTVSVDSINANRETGARAGTVSLWYQSCIVTRSTVDGGQSCFNMTLPVDSRGTSVANWWRFDITGLPSAQANIVVKYRLNTIMGRATDPSVRLGDIRAQWE